MMFPRITAAICVILLIGCLTGIGIKSVGFIGSLLTHSSHVQHDAGTITSISPNDDFVLQLDSGQRVQFQCSGSCLAALPHMQRHEREHALTVVYFVQGATGTLFKAIDVD